MGISLWLASGAAAFAIARIIPIARKRRWLSELLLALASALLLGVLATALDFGGWNETDWRAGVFAGAGALTVLGLWRNFNVAAPR